MSERPSSASTAAGTPAAPASERRARRPARVELLRALGLLAEAPGPEAARVVEPLGLGAVPDAATWSDVFLFQLHPYASVHLGAEGMLGGAARDRVAGFWRAVGRVPPPEPDHLSALLGLYAALCEEAAEADVHRTLLLERSRDALLFEHIAPWVFAFLDRVAELGIAFYAGWADLLGQVLRAEVCAAGRAGEAASRDAASAAAAWGGEASGEAASAAAAWGGGASGEAASGAAASGAVASGGAASGAPASEPEGDPARRERLPAHLRAAPELPDPRVEGGPAFLAGLLAPVRCGFILTRADLARQAATLDLGLRAGERRYALEHLLGQEPVGVLRALAAEAARQGEAHARRDWLGATAAFWTARARRSARLLEDLAVDAAASLTAAHP